jgi:hypothetical protein
MGYKSFDLRRTAGALGAKIVGIDLAKTIDDEVIADIRQAFNPNIISAKGFGETHPEASNDTPQGRAANRRIEITVQGPGAPAA